MRIQELVDGCGEDPGIFSQNVTEGASSDAGGGAGSVSSHYGEGKDRGKRQKKHSSSSFNRSTSIKTSATVVKSTVVRGRQTVVKQEAMLAVRSVVRNGSGEGTRGRNMGRKKHLRKYCITVKLKKYLLIIKTVSVYNSINIFGFIQKV